MTFIYPNDELAVIDDIESLAQDDEVIELGVLHVNDINHEEVQGQEQRRAQGQQAYYDDSVCIFIIEYLPFTYTLYLCIYSTAYIVFPCISPLM